MTHTATATISSTAVLSSPDDLVALIETADAETLQALTRLLDAEDLAKSPASFAQRVSQDTAEQWIPYKHLKFISDKIQALVDGSLGKSRLMLLTPPRHGKSLLASVHTPAWFLTKFPERRVILASYEAEFARGWGRKVRNMIDEHRSLIPIQIQRSSSAADRWDLVGHMGGMITAGAGGPITGRGAHLLIIDDPVKNSELAYSAAHRESLWDWWRTTAFTRLEPGGVVVLIMCMTGDTPVLMGDGREKPLSEIRPGDRVATYDTGKVSVSTVKNWCNQGPDTVYEVRTKSGRKVRANARHPFRVIQENGAATWVRLGSLKAGMKVRSVEARIRVSSAPSQSAVSQPSARACACVTTARPAGLLDIDPPQPLMLPAALSGSRGAMGSPSGSTTGSSRDRMDGARYAESAPMRSTDPGIGPRSFALTMTMTRESCEGFFATTATSSLPEHTRCPSCEQPSSIWNVGVDEIIEIVEVGVTDVFDIEVERTHNFIANGLEVSNTRWHEDDIGGRLIAEDGDNWEIVNLPALAEDDDPLGRQPGEALCPERFDENALGLMRTTMGADAWSALYQQRPQPEGGGRFRKATFKYWGKDDLGFRLRENDGTLLINKDECWWFATVDFAITEKTSGDFTVACVWAVAPHPEPSKLILVHRLRARVVGPDHLPMLEQLWADFPQMAFIGVERASFGIGVIQAAIRRGLPIRELIPDKDKWARSEQAAVMCENGRVYFPQHAPWLAEWEHELLGFPATTHDDQVDAFSYGALEVFRGANFLRRKKKPEPSTPSEKAWAFLSKRDKQSSDHPILGHL